MTAHPELDLPLIHSPNQRRNSGRQLNWLWLAVSFLAGICFVLACLVVALLAARDGRIDSSAQLDLVSGKATERSAESRSSSSVPVMLAFPPPLAQDDQRAASGRATQIYWESMIQAWREAQLSAPSSEPDFQAKQMSRWALSVRRLNRTNVDATLLKAMDNLLSSIENLLQSYGDPERIQVYTALAFLQLLQLSAAEGQLESDYGIELSRFPL